MYDGRELYLANLDWKTTRADVKRTFRKYGHIESVRIPTKVDGTSKGIGYVVFGNKVSSKPSIVLTLGILAETSIGRGTSSPRNESHNVWKSRLERLHLYQR